MYPTNLAGKHPAADLLRKYGTKGCPAVTCRDWTVSEIQQAIDRGPHKSALLPEAVECLYKEVGEKEEKGQVLVIEWNSIKKNPSPKG